MKRLTTLTLIVLMSVIFCIGCSQQGISNDSGKNHTDESQTTESDGIEDTQEDPYEITDELIAEWEEAREQGLIDESKALVYTWLYYDGLQKQIEDAGGTVEALWISDSVIAHSGHRTHSTVALLIGVEDSIEFIQGVRPWKQQGQIVKAAPLFYSDPVPEKTVDKSKWDIVKNCHKVTNNELARLKRLKDQDLREHLLEVYADGVMAPDDLQEICDMVDGRLIHVCVDDEAVTVTGETIALNLTIKVENAVDAYYKIMDADNPKVICAEPRIYEGIAADQNEGLSH